MIWVIRVTSVLKNGLVVAIGPNCILKEILSKLFEYRISVLYLLVIVYNSLFIRYVTCNI